MYGDVSKSQLQANLLPVKILKETETDALISWPVQCCRMDDNCCGCEFWVDKKFLI